MSRVRWFALAVCIVTLQPLFSSCAMQPAMTKDRAVHERILTLDTHLDTPIHFGRPGWDLMRAHEYEQDSSQVDYPRMVRGGLDGGFWVIYTPQGPRTAEGNVAARNAALTTAIRIREAVAAHGDKFALAYNSADASRIAATGKRVVYMSIENGYALGQDATLLSTFHHLGVRMFGPVHFKNNDLGDSSTDTTAEWHGLSPLGKQMVAESNRLGILLDASHASDDVLRQMIELSKTPVILSHSGCKAIYDHPRNVDDALLRELAASGGVIQINSLDSYLVPIKRTPEHARELAALTASYGSLMDLPAEKMAEYLRARRALDRKYSLPKGTFDDFMRHLLHALSVVGADHVGIGADWDGGGGVLGMSDVADIPKITERLLQAGYSEAEIEKIWSGNVLRLLRQAEEYAGRAR
jgi:membrane dipeptidase